MKKTAFLLALLILVLLAVSISAAPTATAGDVVITEIMYNAASDESTTETQYIELFNTTGAPIDVGNWTIDDEDADGPNTIPVGTIIPTGGLLVIAGSSLADFTGAWPTSSGVVSLLDDTPSQTMINLANSPSGANEIIQLRDNLTNLIDEVNYDDGLGWPSDPGGFSIYLNVTVDHIANDNGANWALSSAGTGGAYSSTAFGVWDAVEVGSPGVGYTPTAITLNTLDGAGNGNIGIILMVGFFLVILSISSVFVYRQRNIPA